MNMNMNIAPVGVASSNSQVFFIKMSKTMWKEKVSNICDDGKNMLKRH